MILRINDAVIRGWIDNTRPGQTLGGVELVGFDRPLQLTLRGNCWRDLAGSRLDFINPKPKLQEDLYDKIHGLHRGLVGDITASKKIKVPLISNHEFEEYIESKKEIPFAWQNSIHIEWHSLMDGRILIEGTQFDLTLTPHQWEMDEEEDLKQRIKNEHDIRHFNEIIAEANEAKSHVNREQIGEADEFEWEKRLRLRDSLEEAILFINNDELPDANHSQEQTEKSDDHFGLVRRSHMLQQEVIQYLGKSYLDDGPRSELSMAVAYIHNTLGEAYPNCENKIEIGFQVAVIKRAIDASISAISACNTLAMEDDYFDSLRSDIFIIRDEMVNLNHDLKQRQSEEEQEIKNND